MLQNEQRSEHWSNAYRKVKGIYGDILEIIAAIKENAQLIHRNSTPLAILPRVSSLQPRNTLNVMFMYCELLKETFLEMDYSEEAKRAFIDFCKCEYEKQCGCLACN